MQVGFNSFDLPVAEHENWILPATNRIV